jgi:RNA polymerase sigma-70 factor (ECF subfamily)
MPQAVDSMRAAFPFVGWPAFLPPPSPSVRFVALESVLVSRGMVAERVTPAESAFQSSEADLIARLRAGDEDAFASLVRTNGGRLLASARRFFANRDDAHEVVQDAFLSAYRALDSFKGQALLSTWLHRILVNCCLMKLRSRRRRPEESLEGLLPVFSEGGQEVSPSLPWKPFEDELARRQACALVRTLIQQLPETHRAVLLLRDIEERDTAETADLLGISENAVKIRLHRARQALRSLLDPHRKGLLS